MINTDRRPAAAARFTLLCCTLLAIVACSDSSDNATTPQNYAVSTFYETYVDESRGTPATGEYPPLPMRTLETTILIPEGEGKFPLLIFSHGLGSSPGAYEGFIEAVAAAGYVVVAPLYPLTGANAPAGADPGDTQNQPGDVGFLIDVVTAAVAESRPPFDARVDVESIGTFGHSNGGITTLGVMAHTCCRDPRIGAAVSMSAPAAPYGNGEYDFSDTAPLMLVHGTVDSLIPIEGSKEVFNAVEAPKGMVTLNDVGHGEFLGPSGPGFDTTVNSIIDMFRTHLSGDSAAEDRLKAGVVYDTLAELLYTATGGTDVTLPLPPPVTNRAATVEPSTNLVNDQVVTVSWRNFTGENVFIVQCSQGGDGGNDICELSDNQLLFQPNPTGDGSVSMRIITGDVGSGRCDATTDDCVVVLNDGGVQSEGATIRIPISFAPE
jgi:predicted dienelactone hydrolase